jgi:hypothetical protein
MEIGGRQEMCRDTGTFYRIVVRSELGRAHAAAFDGIGTVARDGDAILTGMIMDQQHLYGILDHTNGLGLELVSVQPLPSEADPDATENREPEEPNP